MKTLFLVASEPLASSAVSDRYAEIERLLAEMDGEAKGSQAGLLQTAMLAATPVEDLIQLKDLAKRLVTGADDAEHLEAARLLYHVSVASAFVHHGRMISGRLRRRQQPMYEALAEQWAEHPLGDLFQRMAATPSED